VALLVVLLVWFGSLGPAPALGSYPGAEQVAADGDSLVGSEVVVAGPVVDTDPVTVEADTSRGPLRVVVRDAPAVRRGWQLRAFGTLEDDGAVAASGTVAVPGWGRPYAWGVSALGVGWVLWRLARTWRVDRHRRALVPRGEEPADGQTGGD
jgi:hypothetical protein